MPITINGNGTITGYTPPIADGSITESKLAANAVTSDKLHNDAVPSAHMPSNTIVQVVQKFKNDPEYLFKMDAEKMINLSRFTSIVMLKFKFVSQNVDCPITLKKSKISRSGREIKSPGRLDL